MTHGKKFATADGKYSPLQYLYGLAQCTPDLSDSDCNYCLRKGISTFSSCCHASQGARVLFPSCNVHYEMNPFYSAPPPPSPFLHPPPPFATPSSPGFCCLTRRVRKKYNSLKDNNGDAISTVQSLQYDLRTIQVATNNFSDDNKIGEGGFGSVYKAWKLWREGMPLALMDPTLEGSYSKTEVTRCIHIALLCVQYDPDVRPSMARVVLKLNRHTATLSLPENPGFLRRNRTGLNIREELDLDQSTSESIQWSVNEASITELDPR
ncbi:hypothetical protein Vadar_017424 [Vaccinium darrowii]|uniref:Uncharacterized protein n=1 Tax=Vaccinium darrowii TaxID=229202 RepID=A0ACB7XAV5_9ERIC|nr:hypothetical protein Vadar_017424 [Vaccinium darrowii]